MDAHVHGCKPVETLHFNPSTTDEGESAYARAFFPSNLFDFVDAKRKERKGKERNIKQTNSYRNFSSHPPSFPFIERSIYTRVLGKVFAMRRDTIDNHIYNGDLYGGEWAFHTYAGIHTGWHDVRKSLAAKPGRPRSPDISAA